MEQKLETYNKGENTVKKEMKINEVLLAAASINNILKNPVPTQIAYWLDKNRKELHKAIKKWGKETQPLFEKYAVEIPSHPFIPADKYQNFKQKIKDFSDCRTTEETKNAWETIEKIFQQFEITVDNSEHGIPPENAKQYQKELNEMAESLVFEVEYTEIKNFSNELPKFLTGEEILAVLYMFEDESKIIPVENKIVIPSYRSTSPSRK